MLAQGLVNNDVRYRNTDVRPRLSDARSENTDVRTRLSDARSRNTGAK